MPTGESMTLKRLDRLTDATGLIGRNGRDQTAS